MRFLTTDQAEAISADRVRMAFLVECQFDTGTVRFTTSAATITYNGIEWLGVGRMLELELPEEDSSLEAHECRISLNGLDPSAISLALNEDLEGRVVLIYCLLYNPDTNAPIGAYHYMRGAVSQVRIIPATGMQ